MFYVVDSVNVADLEKAIKTHGASSVYWLVDGTRAKEGVALGLNKGQVLPIQTLLNADNALLALGEGAELCKCHLEKSSPKSKPKKVVELPVEEVKTEEKADE